MYCLTLNLLMAPSLFFNFKCILSATSSSLLCGHLIFSIILLKSQENTHLTSRPAIFNRAQICVPGDLHPKNWPGGSGFPPVGMKWEINRKENQKEGNEGRKEGKKRKKGKNEAKEGTKERRKEVSQGGNKGTKKQRNKGKKEGTKKQRNKGKNEAKEGTKE